MQEEARDEKDGKEDGQRVTVEELPDTAFPDCPGGRAGQDAFLLLLPLQRARFRRALLPQSDRNQHVHAHLQELAFPVLEGGTYEMAAVQVGPQVQAGAVGLVQFLLWLRKPVHTWPTRKQASNRNSTIERPFLLHMTTQPQIIRIDVSPACGVGR